MEYPYYEDEEDEFDDTSIFKVSLFFLLFSISMQLTAYLKIE